MQINYIFNENKSEEKEEKVEPKNPTAFRIAHNQQEFVFDFIEEETVVERIIKNPSAAKVFLQKLEKSIKEYEEEHGKIKIVQPKQESLLSEMRRNFFVGKKAGKNLRVVNPKRRKR